MATRPLPLGVSVNQAAQDVSIELTTIGNKLRLALKNNDNPTELISIIADALGNVRNAEIHNRTVIEHTGRGKSEQYQ